MAPRSSSASVLVIAGVLLSLVSVSVDGQLQNNFYQGLCVQAEALVEEIVKDFIESDRTLAPSLLRMHFHDCFVLGCEASVLIDSTPGIVAEKDGLPNKDSLRGFNVIDVVKSVLEKTCPGVVSCADIIALVARDAVVAIGGPYWDVPTGRRDGLISLAANANVDLPAPSSNFSTLVQRFNAVGLNQKDVVVLSGAHTIGRAHCRIISPRLYNFTGTLDGIDPSLNKFYARQLRKLCPPGSTNLVNMDPSFGGETFDSNYYANLFSNRGLFVSDEALLTDSRARSRVLVDLFSEQAFFSDFGVSMEKMGRIGVLTLGSPFKGEIRKNCHRIN